MATYKVKGPDGRTVTLRGETPPTESDLDEIFSSLKSEQSVTPTVEKYNPSEVLSSGIPGLAFGRGMNAVKRGASVKDVPGLVVKAASSFYGDTPERIAERPLKTAAAGLFGVARGTAPEKNQLPYPRPVTQEGKELGKEIETAGNVAGLATLASDAPQLIKNARGFIDYLRKKNPEDYYKKAEDILVEVLKPKVSDLNNASARGQESPESLRRTLPYIKPSKDYAELSKTLRTAKVKSAKARNEILRGDNFQMGDEFLDPLKSHIKDLMSRPQTEDVQAELDKAIGVYQGYKDWASKGLSRVKGQVEKTTLQRETEPLLKRAARGEATDRNPDIVKAKDRVRKGLMMAVEGGDPEVQRLNQSYQALNETARMATNQANLARKAPKPNFIERTPVVKQVFQALARNKPYSIQIATEALNQQPSMMKQTKKIADLYERAKALEGVPAGVPGGTPPKFGKALSYAKPSPKEIGFDPETIPFQKKITGPPKYKQITASESPKMLEARGGGKNFSISSKIQAKEKLTNPLIKDSKKINKNLNRLIEEEASALQDMSGNFRGGEIIRQEGSQSGYRTRLPGFMKSDKTGNKPKNWSEFIGLAIKNLSSGKSITGQADDYIELSTASNLLKDKLKKIVI